VSTVALYAAVRTKLTAALPALPIYTMQAPDAATFPCLVWRVTGRSTGPGDDGRLRERGELELQLFGRPLSSLPALERDADSVENALRGWVLDSPTVGQLTIRGVTQRDTLPPFGGPADREVVQIRVMIAYTWWPAFRTDAGAASGSPTL
jgi:hypothetical protein